MLSPPFIHATTPPAVPPTTLLPLATLKVLHTSSGLLGHARTRLLGLEQFISDMLQHMQALKCHHNMTVPAGRLTPEILVRVFLSFRSLVLRDSSDKLGDKLAWTTITDVCQAWRSAALDCADLWSDLPFKTPAHTGLMLDRSREAPLDFKLNTSKLDPNHHWRPVLYKALSQTHRLRTVELVTNDLYIFSGLDVFSLLSGFAGSGQDAPILERLVIASTAPEGDYLPLSLLQRKTPRLRFLEIRRCRFLWNKMQFGGLTHLRLEAISRDPGHTLGRPPVADFNLQLMQMPMLQYLELVGSLPVGRSAEENMAAKPVRLAQLRSLVLHDSVSTITSFFQASQIPQAAIITTIFTDGLHPDNTVGFLWALACSWRDEATASLGAYKMDHRILELSISDCSDTHPERPQLEFWFEHGSMSRLARPDLTIGFSTDMVPLAPLLQSIDGVWTLSSIVSLRLDNCHLMDDAYLLVLCGLANLNTITLQSSSISDLFNALLTDPAFTLWDSALEKGADGQDQTPRFPKLRVIKLLGVDFDPRSRGSPIDDIDLILEALEHRSHEDYCISEMQFELCLNISKVYMEAIRRRAPKVKIGWDGKVDLRSYEEKADEFELEDEDEDEEDEEEEDEGEERQPM